MKVKNEYVLHVDIRWLSLTVLHFSFAFNRKRCWTLKSLRFVNKQNVQALIRYTLASFCPQYGTTSNNSGLYKFPTTQSLFRHTILVTQILQGKLSPSDTWGWYECDVPVFPCFGPPATFRPGPPSTSASSDGLEKTMLWNERRTIVAERQRERETWDWVWGGGANGKLMGHVFDVVTWAGELPVVIGEQGRQQTDCIT